MTDRPSPNSGQPRVLLFLRERSDGDLVTQALSAAGVVCDVTRADTVEALARALAWRPDLVICDDAPRGTGADRPLDLVRLGDPEVPAIVVSGVPGERAAVDAMKRGADAHLLRGDLARLGAVVTEVLDRARTRVGPRSGATTWEGEAGEAMYRLLFESSVLPCWAYDLETLRFLVVNDAAVRRYGYTREEFLSMTIAGIRHDEVLPRVQAAVDTGAAGLKRTGTWRHLTKDGELMFVETYGQVVTLGGRRAELVLTADVTERERMGAELLATRRQMQAILDATPSGILGIDREGRIIFENPAATAMVGCAPDELIGQPAHALLCHRRPDGEPCPVTECPIHRTLADGILRRVDDELWFRRDGSSFPVEYVCTPLRDATGTITGVVVSFVDVSDRRQGDRELKLAHARLAESHALLRIAGRAARLGGWTVSVPDLAIVWSDETAIIHDEAPGFAPSLDAALGYYTPEHRAAIQEAVDRCLRDGTPFDLEASIVTAGGRHRWVRAIGEAARDDDGRIVLVQGAFQDITEVKQANASLAESRRHATALSARLAATLETLADAFVALDPSWRMIYVNAEAERLLGRTRESMLGRIAWEEFPEAVGSTFERESTRAVATGHSVTFETYYPPIDRWVEVRVYPSSEGLAVYFRDVSETRAAREALRVSEERFHLLARATNDAIWDWNLLTDELWWNDGFETLFGFPRREVEPTIESWTSRIHPDDGPGIVADVHRAIDAGTASWSGEYRFLKKDGTYAYVLDRGHVIRDESGRAVRMIGGMTDLTERKLAEQRLREQATLLDQAKDAIMVRDLDHRILYWNRSAERIYGWPAADAVGRSAVELIYADTTAMEAALAVCLATGAWSGELEQVDRDRRRLLVEARWTLVHDEAGAPRSILAINTDVTERKRLEQQFLRAQRLESLGTLAGGIAHDLNNVLSPILLSIGLLQESETDPFRLQTLEVVERSARRGADMVSQVLSFARGLDGRRVAVQVGDLVSDTVKIVADTFPKNIEVREQVASDVHVLQADPTQLHQVLLNLCVNARDAMPAGGRLTLTAENLVVDEHYAAMAIDARPGSYVRLQIEDTGVGIPPEVLDRIFDPFFTTKEPGKGTGLGLSTTLAIVKSHEGFIRVYSDPGVGTRFSVYLPAQAPGVTQGDDGPRTALARGRGELVLVVDDEASIRLVTSQTLEAFGYRALVAADGAEALSLFVQHKDAIDLVLTDMVMPVMDGPAMIQVLRRLQPSLRIVAASGMAATGAVAQVTAAGVKTFLPKPYTADTLLHTIRAALDAEP